MILKIVERIVPFEKKHKQERTVCYSRQSLVLGFQRFMESRGPSKEQLSVFIGKRFEILCREFLTMYLVGKGERLLGVGKWWGL